MGFIVAMFAATIFSIKRGDPKKFMAPIDKNGRFCGYINGNNNDTVEFPNLYLNLHFDQAQFSAKTIFNEGVCVKTCPTKAKKELVFAPGYGTAIATTFPSDKLYAGNSVLGFCLPTAVSPSIKAKW